MQIIKKCPVCSNDLKIEKLKCDNCGLELKNNFELSPFDELDEDSMSFLLVFLKNKGNLKLLQEELHMSYPYAKKKLDDVLYKLHLSEEASVKMNFEPVTIKADADSIKPSEIIKTRLKNNGGVLEVRSVTDKKYQIFANNDGVSFSCRELPIKPCIRYEIFDIVVDCLIENGGVAKKGMGRNARLGEPNCESDTVMYAIGKNYFGKNDGEYTFDPVFVIAAVLQEVGIAYNKRGYIALTPSYRGKL